MKRRLKLKEPLDLKETFLITSEFFLKKQDAHLRIFERECEVPKKNEKRTVQSVS